MKRPRIPGFSLRTKLALVAVSLLALPWIGYRYVQEMERFLLSGQERALAGMARAVATALHNRPQILGLAPRDDHELRRQVEEELRRLASIRATTPTEGDDAVASGPAAPATAAPSTAAPVARPDVEAASADENGEIAAILQGLERAQSRIWVVNRYYRVLALTGSLKTTRSAGTAPASGLAAWTEPLLAWLIRPPRDDFDDAVPDDLPGTGREIGSALRGLPGTRLRNSRDGRAVIVSAAHPIWAGDEVVGAVVVEETTNPIVSLTNRALERLLVLTLGVFALGAGVLLWLAMRISVRVRKLRDEAEGAVDAQGRITRLTAGSAAGDEIGDLSRSFSRVLAKLGQHHAYLESMASRLSHELRTPIAVVRSSLENLRLQSLPDPARVYIERADAGVTRLSTLLTRMSEATRLEESMQSAERERFDLAQIVAGCVAGYRQAYPGRAFALTTADEPLWLSGSPDLIAQMLDKLVGNATDFAAPATVVELALRREANIALLTVTNQGPELPQDLRARLFESMVSIRANSADGQPHLGLGLYIVRLVAEYHGGTARADNLENGNGVRLAVRLPLLP